MTIYKSAEDYLERIYMLQLEGKMVRSIDIANSFNYSRASISRAINNLKDHNYITIQNNGIISLTESGLDIAIKMYNRHKLLTDFFVNIGVPYEIATDDACKIEHDLSDETFEIIKKYIDKFNKENQ